MSALVSRSGETYPFDDLRWKSEARDLPDLDFDGAIGPDELNEHLDESAGGPTYLF